MSRRPDGPGGRVGVSLLFTMRLRTDTVPPARIRPLNDQSASPEGAFVLYWMIAFRRTGWNFALQRAVDWARELAKPLLVLEALNIDYPWVSHRFHRFVVEGMVENAARIGSCSAFYFPYVEPEPGAGHGLVRALAGECCLVVTDDFPCFFLPSMVEKAGGSLPVLAEKVDSNGLLPLSLSQQPPTTAFSFRRRVQEFLPDELHRFPRSDPLAKADLPPARPPSEKIRSRWPAFDLESWEPGLKELPVEGNPGPGWCAGGSRTGRSVLREFLEGKLERYLESRHPDEEACSGLSPYLHFGHLSSHEIFCELMSGQDWSPHSLSPDQGGRRRGWWNLPPAVESFLDQLITWRELGFHFSHLREDYDRYSSLPEWARTTLREHNADERPWVYSREQFESAGTHDEIWNAAQSQLIREGRIHNYLRMLWGKKILHWSESPREALSIMIELNNRYALDGRDPNSYSGIFWCLGRFDRAWGPVRPVFGKIRYMSSRNTRRKLRLTGYLERFGNSSARKAT